jgi:hypothetical protein
VSNIPQNERLLFDWISRTFNKSKRVKRIISKHGTKINETYQIDNRKQVFNPTLSDKGNRIGIYGLLTALHDGLLKDYDHRPAPNRSKITNLLRHDCARSSVLLPPMFSSKVLQNAGICPQQCIRPLTVFE